MNNISDNRFRMTFAPGFPINCNDSAAVWSLRLNPITGTARVRWSESPRRQYRYKASRREMLKMIWFSGNQSKGQWVNRHCTARG